MLFTIFATAGHIQGSNSSKGPLGGAGAVEQAAAASKVGFCLLWARLQQQQQQPGTLSDTHTLFGSGFLLRQQQAVSVSDCQSNASLAPLQLGGSVWPQQHHLSPPCSQSHLASPASLALLHCRFVALPFPVRSFQRLVFTTAAKIFSSTYRVMVEGDGADAVGYLNPLMALATTINVSRPGQQPDLVTVQEDMQLLDSSLVDKQGACVGVGGGDLNL